MWVWVTRHVQEHSSGSPNELPLLIIFSKSDSWVTFFDQEKYDGFLISNKNKKSLL